MGRLKLLLNGLRKEERADEGGNTLVMFVMLFPVMFSIFGLAIDVSIANFIKNSVQGSVNTATQITLSQASNPVNSDSPMLSYNEAETIVKRLYAQNTGRGTGAGGSSGSSLPFLLCQDSPKDGGSLMVSPTVSACAWTEPAGGFNFTRTNRMMSIDYTTVETSRTAFLQFLGVGSLTYKVTGKASTNFSGNLG